MNIVLGFGQHHVDETIAIGKSLAMIALHEGEKAFQEMVAELRSNAESIQPLASVSGSIIDRCEYSATVTLSQLHVRTDHPLSPDGVAGFSIRVFAVAYRGVAETEVACGVVEIINNVEQKL